MDRIKTNKAPKAIGTYSQGTRVGDFVFTIITNLFAKDNLKYYINQS